MDNKKTKRREELRLKLNAKLAKDRTVRGGKRRYELKSHDDDKTTAPTTTAAEDGKTSDTIKSAITSFESILKKEGTQYVTCKIRKRKTFKHYYGNYHRRHCKRDTGKRNRNKRNNKC